MQQQEGQNVSLAQALSVCEHCTGSERRKYTLGGTCFPGWRMVHPLQSSVMTAHAHHCCTLGCLCVSVE